MKILAFDTSHSKCSVAISVGNQIVTTVATHESNKQAEMLLLLIEQSLDRAALSYQDLDFLAVTTGPGSFTGVRIGLAAAEGVLMASNIKPIGISSLEAINFRAQEHARNFDHSVVLMDAYRSQLYVQTFDVKGKSVSEPKLIECESIMDYLSKISGKLVLLGNGVAFVEEDFEAVIFPRFQQVNAKTLCRLAYAKVMQGDYSSDLSPLYIRPPDAKKARS